MANRREHEQMAAFSLRGTLFVTGMAALASLFATRGGARAATPAGVEIGVRSGYGLPVGQAASAAALSSDVVSVVPIWLDAGYRFNPHMAVSGFFQYSFGKEPSVCRPNNCWPTDPPDDILFGAQFHYHLFPAQSADPWVGIGAGYEILQYTTEGGDQISHWRFDGFDFLNLQAGIDFKAMPNLGIGPFVMLSEGLFSYCSTLDWGSGSGGPCPTAHIASPTVHGWLTFGIRVAFDINISEGARSAPLASLAGSPIPPASR